MSQTQSNSSRKILVILALSLFIIALILVIVSSMTPGSKKSFTSSGNTFADGYNTARDQAAKTGFPGITDPVASLAGSVLETKNNTITIETNLFVNEKVDGVGPNRVITLAEGGKVVRRTQIDQQKMIKAMEAFQEKMKNADPAESGMITPPAMYEDKEISISDIKTGEMILAEGDGADLRLQEAIAAKTVIVFTTSAPAPVSETPQQ